MKSERILDALSHVDDNLLELCETYTPVRRFPWRWCSAAACVALAALSAVLALHTNPDNAPKPAASTLPAIFESVTTPDLYSESSADEQKHFAQAESSTQIHLPNETLPDSATSNGKGTADAIQETATVPAFSSETIPLTTKYPSLYRGGQHFTSRGLSKPILGEALKEHAVLTGFDGIHTTEVVLFTIRGVNPDAAVAVQFPETGKAYAYVNTDYTPATLGQFWDDLNLNEYLSFGRVYFGTTDYIDPSQSEIDKLLNRSAPCTAGDSHLKNVVLFIDIDVPVLGYTNHAFQLTSDGYLHTNLLESGKSFYIGKERVNRFVAYVQASCTAVSYTPTTVAYTAVMTSGAKCPVEE